MDTTETQTEMGTNPIKEHAWLQNLVGEWKVENEMAAEPGAPMVKSEGSAHVASLDGLWAFSECKEFMPDGRPTTSYFALGYDVTFKEYRGCIVMSASSHLWKYAGTLSEDGKTMTLDCEGPSMTDDGTALYREVIELIDHNHRTQTSYLQDEQGEWQLFATARYTRA